MDRPEEIARAAVELVAEGGSHALTHRRIDRRLGWPEGTTSNYARTRRALVMLVIDRVAELATFRDLSSPVPTTVPGAVEQLVAAFEAVAARGSDTRARMALTIDCLHDPELHELLTTRSPVRAKLLDQAHTLLAALGVPHPDRRAIDFIAVMNGLLYDRLIGNGVRGVPADAHQVLEAWLTGIGARSQHPTATPAPQP